MDNHERSTLEQILAMLHGLIGRDDADTRLVGDIRLPRPADLDQPIVIDVPHIRAVRTVNGDAPAAGDKSHDFVPRDGRTAAGITNQKPVHSLDDDAARGFFFVDFRLDDLFRQFLPIVVDEFEKNLIGRDRAVSDGSEHFVLPRKRHAAGQLEERLVRQELGERKALALCLRFQHRLARLDVLLLHLPLEELLDLHLGGGAFDDFQPVPAWSL